MLLNIKNSPIDKSALAPHTWNGKLLSQQFNAIRHRSTPVKMDEPLGALSLLMTDEPSGALPLLMTIWLMVQHCYWYGGRSLSAPQIGLFKQIFVIREDLENFRVFINPKCTILSSEPEIELEDCLSVSYGEVAIPVRRSSVILAKWQTLTPDGQLKASAEVLEGLRGRLYQHELDHLQGVCILNREIRTK